jgi:colanic acid/amylovoran biosynthesis glycosyltransferase
VGERGTGRFYHGPDSLHAVEQDVSSKDGYNDPSHMRLAYLVSQYPALTHTFILSEIRALGQMGFEIEVISIRPPDRPLEKLSDVERDEATRTWAVFQAGLFGWMSAHLVTLISHPARYLSGLWGALALSRLNLRAALLNLAYFAEAVVAGHRLQARGITHVHTHFSSTVALFLARVFDVTFSVTVHGPDEFNDALGFYLAEKVAEARFIVATTQFARSQLMRASESRYWHKLEVLPQGVDPNLFTPRPHRESAPRFELISVGRLARVKAHAILIQAVARLVLDGRASILLRVVGGGPERESLEQLVREQRLQEHVVFEGPCGQDRVRELYRGSDIFVLASFAEGVPTVLMEAMATELPCIATWVSGVPELIRHGVDGWLVAPSDADALAAAIGQLMDEPDVRRRLGQAGRARVQDRFTLAKNAKILSGIYTRRLASTSS